MDPTQTLCELTDALEAGDYDSAHNYAVIYQDWRDTGGFPGELSPEQIDVLVRAIGELTAA